MTMPASRRSAAMAALLTALTAFGGGSGAAAGPRGEPEPDPCDGGWRNTTQAAGRSVHDVDVRPDGSALAVGSVRQDAARRPAAMAWDGTRWADVAPPPAAADSALTGIAGRKRIWAVGFDRGQGTSIATTARLEDAVWVPADPPDLAGSGEVLTAVDVGPGGDVWAVGFRGTARSVRKALAWRHRAGRWTREPVPAAAGTALTSVLAVNRSSVHAAGSRLTARGLRPLLLHWDGTTWRSDPVPDVGREGVITALAGSWQLGVHAVGWRTEQGDPRPLVLERVDGVWTVREGPELGGRFSLLLGASLDAQGRLWVTGTSYRDTIDRFVPMLARRDDAGGGGGWTVWPQHADGGRWLGSIVGDPLGTGWSTGRAIAGSVLTQACEPVGPAGDRRRTTRARRLGPAGRPIEDAGPAGPRPRPIPRPTRRLSEATEPTTVQAIDVAPSLGLGGSFRTVGAVVADLDGDDRADLFVPGHAAPASMWLRRDDGYELQPRERFPLVDRHDCAAGRIDPGPMPDLLCSVGADSGFGLKANELWIDPGTGATDERAAAAGLADPWGRGRNVVLFDADGDGDLDAFLGNLAMRFDGLPSPNRLLRNDGEGHFTWDPDSGLTSDRGAWCAFAADLDRDGDDDLVLCGYTGNVMRSADIVAYRNEDGRFVDATADLGVSPLGEVDAAAGQLDGEGALELVQLSRTHLRISAWSQDGYVPVFERAVTAGKRVALGDVDGDGDLDLYLQLGGTRRNDPDTVLLNDGTARGWVPIAIPSTSDGVPDDVVAFDHDGNGLSDFLVLNGAVGVGPIELIAFYPAEPPPGEP